MPGTIPDVGPNSLTNPSSNIAISEISTRYEFDRVIGDLFWPISHNDQADATVMKRKREAEEIEKVIISHVPVAMISSQATSVTDSSIGLHSAQNSRSTSISELPVPELDDDISTDDFTSDYLSTWTASVAEPEGRILESHDEIAASHFDAVSIYSPSHHHYPAPPVAYRIEEPFGDDETLEEETM